MVGRVSFPRSKNDSFQRAIYCKNEVTENNSENNHN